MNISTDDPIWWQRAYDDDEWSRLEGLSDKLGMELLANAEVPNVPADMNYYVEKVVSAPGRKRT